MNTSFQCEERLPLFQNSSTSFGYTAASKIRNQLIKRLTFLGIIIAGVVACNENTPIGQCGISSSSDTTNDTGKISGDAGIDAKVSGIPATTIPILKHAITCYAAYDDTRQWCNSFILSRIPSDPNFCDTFFIDEPKSLQDICHKKTEDCLTGEYWKKFKACLETIPADSACKAILQPTSMLHDSDGDGLSDHFELWHAHTNPCEPCSYGDSTPCDAEASYDNDGVSNKDAKNFFGGCNSTVGTDECG